MSNVPELEIGAVGTVVFLAERGELTCARVAVREGSRYVLENLIGERFAVAGGRLFWAGRAAVATVGALPSYWAEVRRLAAEVDLAVAWHALEARSASADTGIAVVAALALKDEIGRIADKGLAEDAVALAVFGDTTFFKMKERVLLRESAPEVALTQKKKADKELAKRKLRFAVEAFKARLGNADAGAGVNADAGVCVGEGVGAGAEVGAGAAEAIREYRAALIDVAANGRESERWAFVARLCEALGVPADKAFDLLVRLGELAPKTNLAPYRANLPLVFSDEVLTEAERLAAYRPTPGADMTQLDVIAIDDADTTEVDDAVALEGTRVWVFISDAAAWVQAGGVVDRSAAERTATVYLPDGKLPMLPPVLSDGPLSLLCGGTRQSLAFSFEIGNDGQLTGFEMKRATVRIARRLTYEETDQILASTQPSPTAQADPHRPLLTKLQALMDRHRGWRNGRGAVQFQRPEVYFDVIAGAGDEGPSGGRVKLKIGDPLGPARQLIQELMVATCAGVAVFCAENQIPCIYRAQAAPDTQPQRGLGPDPRTGRIDDTTQQYELLRRLKPSVVQLEVAPHWTLGVPAYTQVTSPIRRYADLLMHQQLSSFLRTGRPLFPAGKLQAHLFELGRRAALVRRVEQESRRFFALRFLEQNAAQVLTGTVLREIGKKTLLELQPLALQELVALKKRRPAGTVIRFEVVSADSRADAIQLKELA